jgi:hydroxymethylglutaryl-CoA reductase (NADPH)
MTVPLGAVGPLKLDGREYMVPMATTEGCLIASTNRGCSALKVSGVKSCITNDGMTRAPVLRYSKPCDLCSSKSKKNIFYPFS